MKNENTRRNIIVSIATILLAVSIGATSLSVASFEHAGAQMSSNSGMMSAAGQNQSKMMTGTYGPNITGSIPLGPTIAKAISSQVHVSLANASITAEKAVGPNAHAAAVRIGVVHGFLVYMALIIDSNYIFHAVLVDAGNGKVLASTQMSNAEMMHGNIGINSFEITSPNPLKASLQGANMTARNIINSTTSNATTAVGSINHSLSVVRGPLIVGNRTLSLALNVHPLSNLTNASTESIESMHFRLFNTNNNQTIKHVTYEVTMTKENSSLISQKPLLVDFFHAHNGLLTLHIQPANGPLTIFAKQDPILQAWVADPSGNIFIRGPVLLDRGLYHFHVQIFTIDNDRSLFIPQQAPKFDASLNIGGSSASPVLEKPLSQKH
jgi:hypothetical protein